MGKKSLLYLCGCLMVAGGGAAFASGMLEETLKVQTRADEDVALRPLKADVEATFNIDPATKKGFVTLTVTAPTKGRDENWEDFDIPGVDKITLYRSKGYYDDEQVAEWENVKAGETLIFIDTAELELGSDYTYSTKTYLKDTEGYSGYGYVTFGVKPATPASPKIETVDGKAPLTITYVCPAEECGSYWNLSPFPEGVKYTEIRLYKKDADGEVVLRSDKDPNPGDEYSYVVETAPDGYNTYYLRTFTDYGSSDETYSRVFLGDDYPSNVRNVSAVENDGKVTVTWDAPTEGYNGGIIDPAKVAYKIYRVDNNYFNNPELLADAVTECEYVDNLEGLNEEKTLYYRVYPYNHVEAPENTRNYGETTKAVIAGPPAPLPFKETFNSGNKFNKVFDKLWEEDFDYYTFSQHYLRADQYIESDGEMKNVACGVDGKGTDETGPDNFYLVSSSYYSSSTAPGYLVSGNLSFANVSNPVVSFYYIPLAGAKSEVAVEFATGETDEDGKPIFVKVAGADFGKLPTGEDADPAAELQWKQVKANLKDLAGLERTKLRLKFQYLDAENGRYAMLIDHVQVEDYPGVADLIAAQEGNGIKLSWVLPESAGDKAHSFSVMLDGKEIARTDANEYFYENAEQGESYDFSVATIYADGTEAPVAVAETLVIALTDFTVDDKYYVVSEAGESVTLEGYVGNDVDLVIPATVTYKGVTYTVDHLLPMLFNGQRKLKSVVIEAEVESIPESFFYGCTGLENVTLPATLKSIQAKAFYGCASMKGIELPEALETIGKAAFENCRGIESIAFGSNLAEIGEEGFMLCSSLKSVAFSTAVPPTVGNNAFKDIAEGCVGTCPAGSAAAYSAEPELSTISFQTTSVAGLTAEGAESVEYYTLSGQKVQEPVKGETVIVRARYSDGSVKTFKRIVR